VDPHIPDLRMDKRITAIAEKAGSGMQKVLMQITQLG
jgi:hypothetical protein